MSGDCESNLNNFADKQFSAQPNSQLPTVEVINEKVKELGEEDGILKPTVSISLLKDKIMNAQKGESEVINSLACAEESGENAQTPYYQQQVKGQPVYIQGTAPVEAGRTPTYRSRNEDEYFRDATIFNESFDDIVIRNRFVQKVYTILTVQLVYTFGFITFCIFTPAAKHFLLTHLNVLIIAAVAELSVLVILVCSITARRNFPLNFILLAILTVGLSYLLALTSLIYSTDVVLTSMGLTAIICLLVSLFACQTSYDITTWGLYLFIASIAVVIYGSIYFIVRLTTGYSNVMHFYYSLLIAILFTAFLIYDTQMIMGGRTIELSPEEYIFGALTLYLDIVYIFWAILQILGELR